MAKSIWSGALTRTSSIPTDSRGEDGAASVMMRPACTGHTRRDSRVVRFVFHGLELAGIKNVLATRLASKHPLNNPARHPRPAGVLPHPQETAKERGILRSSRSTLST